MSGEENGNTDWRSLRQRFNSGDVETVAGDGYDDEEIDEKLAITASKGISHHDLGPLRAYFQKSPLSEMHPAIFYTLMSILEGEIDANGEGMILKLVKAPGAKRMPRSGKITDKTRAHRIRAIVGFSAMNGWAPGCYDAGMTNAAKVAGISIQRAKQLLTPEYRSSIKRYLVDGFETPSERFDNLCKGAMDFVVPAEGIQLAKSADGSFGLVTW